jgi:hypothetical protein
MKRHVELLLLCSERSLRDHPQRFWRGQPSVRSRFQDLKSKRKLLAYQYRNRQLHQPQPLTSATPEVEKENPARALHADKNMPIGTICQTLKIRDQRCTGGWP